MENQNKDVVPYSNNSGMLLASPEYKLAFENSQRFAKLFYAAGVFTDTKSESVAAVKVLAGAELGLSPMVSMKELSIIQGKITLSYSIVGAMIKGTGKYDYRVVSHDDKHCQIEFFSHGQSIGFSSFSIEDAKARKLLEREQWSKMPKVMLFARALTGGARMFCPEILKGSVYTPDEAEDLTVKPSLQVISNNSLASKIENKKSEIEEEKKQLLEIQEPVVDAEFDFAVSKKKGILE